MEALLDAVAQASGLLTGVPGAADDGSVPFRSSLPALTAALAVGAGYGIALALLIAPGWYDCVGVPNPFGPLGEVALGIVAGLMVLPVACAVLYQWALRRAPSRSPVLWFGDLVWYLMVAVATVGAVAAFLVSEWLWRELMAGPCWRWGRPCCTMLERARRNGDRLAPR